MATLPESAHKGVLRELCKDLAAVLEEADEDIEARLPGIMQALSSIGRIAPDIFAQHAAAVADFVLDVSLPAPIISLCGCSLTRVDACFVCLSIHPEEVCVAH